MLRLFVAWSIHELKKRLLESNLKNTSLNDTERGNRNDITSSLSMEIGSVFYKFVDKIPCKKQEIMRRRFMKMSPAHNRQMVSWIDFPLFGMSVIDDIVQDIFS